MIPDRPMYDVNCCKCGVSLGFSNYPEPDALCEEHEAEQYRDDSKPTLNEIIETQGIFRVLPFIYSALAKPYLEGQ